MAINCVFTTDEGGSGRFGGTVIVTLLTSLLLVQVGTGTSLHRSDATPLSDPGRLVDSISRTGFELRYATNKPCETKIEVRPGSIFAASGGSAAPMIRVVAGSATASLWHTLSVTGLQAGQRYYFRLYDPGSTPGSLDLHWGAEAPWSREYAVSTLAPVGKKTIIHLPVKVLLMPNVVNAESAVQPDGSLAPEPSKATSDQIALIESEYRLASREFWVNSGMRLWVDFRFFVDDRWQRWGPQAPSASAFFQNLPECRSYAGQDYVAPGGGEPTVVDAKDITKVGTQPVGDNYVSQVEMAWPRRWDPARKIWQFYTSGSYTTGVEDLTHGLPVRSQLLAGSDTAWLVASAIHRQLEVLAAQSLENTEDDRLASDTSVARHRFRRGDGTYDEQPWNTAGLDGEAWDVLRYWDGQVTDVQWLRFGFGTTETVVDKNGDAFPDNDPRLPLDAARFAKFAGTSSYSAACDYNWVGLPIQSSWLKSKAKAISSLAADAILPFHPSGQANDAEWSSIPTTGTLSSPDLKVTFKQAYDEGGYYGLITTQGPLAHLDVDLDGDNKGIYAPPEALGFTMVNLKPAAGEAGPMVLPVAVRPTFGVGPANRPPTWMTWNAARKADGTLVFAFKIPNGGDGPWYWRGAGHKIGVSVNAYDQDGRGWSMGEPYRLRYAEMVKARGIAPWPAAPAALTADEVTLKPGDKSFGAGPNLFTLPNQKIGSFDLVADVLGSGEFLVGAYAPQTPRPELDRDYSALLTSAGATLSIYGEESELQPMHLGDGAHKVELRRRENGVWLLVDGQVRAYQLDSNPHVLMNRFAVTAGPGSKVVLRSLSYREEAPAVPVTR